MTRSTQNDHWQSDLLLRPMDAHWSGIAWVHGGEAINLQPHDLRGAAAKKRDAKIHDLFQRRGILGYARRFLCQQELHLWQTWAQDAQRKIYALDDFYELNAKLGNEGEHRLWDELGRACCGSRSKGREALEAAVEALHQYGVDEARIHSGGTFEACEWTDISWRKSADVNLARELVYVLMSNKEPSRQVRSFMRSFDQVMELVEDTEDLHEDGFDWNLNFWLTPVRQGRDVVESVGGTMGAVQELCVMAQEAWDRLSFSEQIEHENWWRCLCRCAARLVERPDQIVAVVREVLWTPYEDLLMHGAQKPNRTECADAAIATRPPVPGATWSVGRSPVGSTAPAQKSELAARTDYRAAPSGWGFASPRLLGDGCPGSSFERE